MFCVPLSFSFAPRRVPAGITADTPTAWAETLFFRHSHRYPSYWRGEPSGEPPRPEEEKPLTPMERLAYTIFGVWVALTFLAIFVMVALLHSPYNAN